MRRGRGIRGVESYCSWCADWACHWTDSRRSELRGRGGWAGWGDGVIALSSPHEHVVARCSKEMPSLFGVRGGTAVCAVCYLRRRGIALGGAEHCPGMVRERGSTGAGDRRDSGCDSPGNPSVRAEIQHRGRKEASAREHVGGFREKMQILHLSNAAGLGFYGGYIGFERPCKGRKITRQHLARRCCLGWIRGIIIHTALRLPEGISIICIL